VQVEAGNAAPQPAAYHPMGPAPQMPGGLIDIDDEDQDQDQDQNQNQNRHPDSNEDEDENESEDEPQNGAAMLPIRIARGLVNMFWGGRPTNPPESDSEEDEEVAHDAEDP
jgi:hypothetical protein